jgi:hypothetical protein
MTFRIQSRLLALGAFCFAGANFLLAAGLATPAMKSMASPHMPFAFVENRGQADAHVRFIGTGPEFKAWFEDRGVILQQRETVVSVTFEGGAKPAIGAEEPLGGTANYLRGRDPAGWQTNLPLFGEIRYTGVWPGIEVTYRTEQSRVAAEYRVAPGAAVNQIRLRFDGDARIQADGALRVSGRSGDFVERKPVLFQSVDGRRVEVAGAFQRLPDGAIGFRAGDYDHARPLVIDPSILFSGFFGGTTQEGITAIAVNYYSNVIVAGWTSSTDLPASAGAQIGNGGGVDAFVASFSPDGGSLNYCTYLGGSGDDRAFAVTVDAAMNTYLTGWTQSVNFPLKGAFQTRLSGPRDAFVAKLNPAGNALLYSTYLGGTGSDTGYAIAVDGTGAAIVAGDSTSTNLPVTAGAFRTVSGGAQDAFVAKLSPAGNALFFLTYLGGSGIDHASSLALDVTGTVYVAGYTWSANFPVVSAYQPQSGGGQDGFVSRLSANGMTMIFSTYLGGHGGSTGAPEEVNGLAVDQLGYAVVAGTTSSANFPVTAGAFQTAFGGETDGFVSRFSPAGMLLESTYLGGTLSDGINAIALDFHGTPYVTGFTISENFPVQNPLQSMKNGTENAFVVKLNTTLSGLIFSTYLGGSGSDAGNAIFVDAQTSIIIGGQTSSFDFPVLGNMPTTPPSQLSSFVTKMAPNFNVGTALPSGSALSFVTDPWRASGFVQVSLFGNATDIPVVGDWTNTGVERIGVFRNGYWYLDTNNDGVLDAGDQTVIFGEAGDIPLVGDWDGSGRTAVGLYRGGTFILDVSGRLSGVPTGVRDAPFAFGLASDIPVVADWNGSGTTKVGVFRNGEWLIDYNGTRTINQTYVYGQAGDVPVVGDWDSSGKPNKIGVYRQGIWILDYDGDNAWTIPGLNQLLIGFGSAGFPPLVF